MSKNDKVPVVDLNRNALADRIRIIMGSLSQREFAQKIGIGQATLSQYLLGKTEPSWSTLVMMAQQSGRTLEWLMTGQEPPGAAGSFSGVIDGGAGPLHVHIDRYDLHASAGNGSPQFDAPAPSKWIVPREMLNNYKGTEDQLLSTDVVGDSMQPTLEDGQAIIVDTIGRFDREGVYLLTIGDDLFVKRLRRIVGEDGRLSLSLISDNPAYPELTLGPDTQERVRIIGRVIWPDTSRRRF